MNGSEKRWMTSARSFGIGKKNYMETKKTASFDAVIFFEKNIDMADG